MQGPAAAGSYLELVAAGDEALGDAGQPVVAEVEHAEVLQVPELVRAEHGVEVVAQHVVAQVDLLQRVLGPVKQPDSRHVSDV